MKYIVLMDGTKYPLASKGVDSRDEKVTLKLVTEDSLEKIAEAFRPDNTEFMFVINEEEVSLVQIKGFTRRGNVIKKEENTIIGTKIIPEEVDDKGRVISEPRLEEEYGSIVVFSMYKERIEDRVLHNRADIDYLLMMEG